MEDDPITADEMTTIIYDNVSIWFAGMLRSPLDDFLSGHLWKESRTATVRRILR